jgi:putative ABC transport system substrate-binding protein
MLKTPGAVVLAIGCLLGASSQSGHAQDGGKVYRIGILEMLEATANADNLGAFRHGLKDLGYLEGQHFAIEYRSADGRPERLQALARELVRLDVDLIVTSGTPAAIWAKHATATIPIVMAWSGEPAAQGIVASLARPGGNVTGLYILAPPEVGGTRLKLLREVVPSSSRVGILWNPADMQTPLLMRETQKVARAMTVRLESFEVQRPERLEQAFEAALMAQVDAFIAIEDTLTLRDRTRIIGFAAMSRLPAIYGLREFVDAGGLMSYGTDRRDLFRRSAGYVHKILKGARPADLPVEPPRKFELAINLKTATALRLTIPPSVLQRADYIVR